MNHLYAGVLVAIVLGLLTVSISRLRKTHTKADYLVAGRSLPAFVLVFTLLSSWIGSGSLLGGAENAYKHGFAALWQAGGGWAGLALIYFIAPRARKFAQFTIPDLLEVRYNQAARVLGVIAVLFTYTAITSYQLIGGGDILHLVFPAAISADRRQVPHRRLRHCLHRHRRHVAPSPTWTCSSACSPPSPCSSRCPFLMHRAGGWHGVHAALPATPLPGPRRLHVFIQALELFLPTMLLMLGNQSMYQKFFSAKSEKAARQAVVGWVIGTVILETVIVALAVVGSVVFPTGEVHEHPREIIAWSALAWAAAHGSARC